MGQLIYGTHCTLDGYIEDADGSFEFSVPSDDAYEFLNDYLASFGTLLFGRRLYETMAVWETMDTSEMPAAEGAFAEIWANQDKVVYSRTLESPTTARTTLEREFDPEKVAALKQTATSDILIGGADLAAQAFAAGLIDEVWLILSPVSVGAGKPALPTGQRLDFELIEQRRFDNGGVHVQYRVV